MLDWGPISQPPCYAAAVHNIKAIAKCTADLLTDLRQHGLRTDRLTCVGHSLGNDLSSSGTSNKTITSVKRRPHVRSYIKVCSVPDAQDNRIGSGEAPDAGRKSIE